MDQTTGIWKNLKTKTITKLDQTKPENPKSTKKKEPKSAATSHKNKDQKMKIAGKDESKNPKYRRVMCHESLNVKFITPNNPTKCQSKKNIF